MAWWEADPEAQKSIVAVPGCTIWQDEAWGKLCQSKEVVLAYDSDHPKTNALGHVARAGWDGMQRVAGKLRGSAASVHILYWGPEGYDPEQPSGYDVRDLLSGAPGPVLSLKEREPVLQGLLERVDDVPAEWTAEGNGNGRVPGIQPLPCSDWLICEAAWVDALEWRRDLSDVMLVMLATASSTDRAGDNQLFLQVVGDPGTAKTRMCKGLLASRKCKALLHLKSFHSGYKKPGEHGKDCSYVARINGYCLVTPEYNALALGMNSAEIDKQARQIFDGESGNTYANDDTDRQYKGLRTPWVQAGTPDMMDKDQSRLGDRFIRIRIESPTEYTKRAILLRSLRNERQAMRETSDGTEASIIPPRLRHAYAVTGGFVDWLRANIDRKIGAIDMDEEAEYLLCDMAALVSDLRARPNMDPRKYETHHSKEMGSRLAGQFGRLATCLAVVLGKEVVDREVLRIIRRVAFDTGYGHTLNIVRLLCQVNPKTGDGRTYQECGGLAGQTLANWMNVTPERAENYAGFLRRIDVLDLYEGPHGGNGWVLTPRVHDLYRRVLED
jgi:hypothetical protein